MKLKFYHIWPAFLAAVVSSAAQGVLQYDQQVFSGESPPPFGHGNPIQQVPPPFGQSFTPALTSVDFVRLIFDDANPSNQLGAALYINLRQDSITGTVLSSTSPVSLPDNFRGTVDFLFPSPVAVTPGTQYYFEPLVASGDAWNIILLPDTHYAGGTGIAGGQPAFYNLWFREGIIVPEPSFSALILLGGGAAYAHRRKSRKTLGRPKPN